MLRPCQPPQFHTWKLSDGYELHGRIWPPGRTDPAMGVLYLHGIQSHGGWFEWSASRLAGGGWAVLLPDRRGSGLNYGARGDTPNLERWLDDLDELAEWCGQEWGIRRLGVVGVSWGGKPALAWTLRRPERVGRLLLIAPGLFPAVGVRLAEKLRIATCALVCPRRQFRIPLDDPALFTDDPAGQAFIAADPLKLSRATARFLYHSVRLDRRLLGARPGSLTAPTTLILAGRDRIIRNEPTVEWLTRVAASRPEIHVLPGAAHTLEFEPDLTGFDRLIAGWAGQ